MAEHWRIRRFKLRGKLLAKVARQGKVAPLIAKGGLESDRYNLSVRLKRGRARAIKVLIAEIGGHFSIDTKCGVDGAVTEITHSGEVVVSRRIIGGTNCNNLSVGLDQDRKGIVFHTDKIGGDHAT